MNDGLFDEVSGQLVADSIFSSVAFIASLLVLPASVALALIIAIA